MQWSTISVTVSLLVGLSIARTLTGLVAMFRSRRDARLYWPAFVWAGVILLTLLNAWAALNDVPKAQARFSFFEYLLLGLMIMTLYTASALLLPAEKLEPGDSLKKHFDDEGRLALVLYAAFGVLSALVELVIFERPLHWARLINEAVLFALPVATFAAPTERLRKTLTLVFFVLYLLELTTSALIFLPGS